MRLTKLKLAGFKSFVEPTVVLFPGQLAGVVGPNGCGKSNIIDAVRWVLGESKASELRGESIQDVIFKGSGQRKEVSRASVEMFFDNALGRAVGQWSQFAEITVKRVLDRDGNSSYYINNLHVRRRDMIDLFLGTGLGPRAYAIIGQGMISRIVEAKPEELRFFLEEAAGVTKYKERRKETHNRLEDAAENLARVDDIRNELETQVSRLQGQAEVARTHRDLTAGLLRTQTLLWLKKRNDAHADSERLERQIAEAGNRVEEQTTQLREIEVRVEQARELHFSASDALHSAQSEMFAANSEVSRLEQSISHLTESRLRLEARLLQLDADSTSWRSQQAELSTEASRWNSLLEHAQLRAATATERHDEAQSRLPQAEDTLQAAMEALATARRTLNETEQSLRLSEAEKIHAQRSLDAMMQRRARLEADRQALGEPDPALLAAAIDNEAVVGARLSEAHDALAQMQAALPDAEARLRQSRDALQAAHRTLTETRARHEALTQLQARVAPSGEIGAWLQSRGLKDAKPLWQMIKVASGWETAVEAVLRERFAALMADTATMRAALTAPPPTLLSLAHAGTQGTGSVPEIAAGQSLRSKVSCDDPHWSVFLDECLSTVLAVEELTVESAQDGFSRVSRAGHLLTPAGLNLYVPDAKTHGVIERQRDIDELASLLLERQAAEVSAREVQQAAENQLAECQAGLADARRSAQEAQQALHSAQVEALKLTQAKARFDERAGQIDADVAELTRQHEAEQARLLEADNAAETARERQAQLRGVVDQALALHGQSDLALREARNVEASLAREAQEAKFSERECVSKLEDNTRAAATAEMQLARIDAELLSARTELDGISDAVLQEQLHTSLESRKVCELALVTRRQALEAAATDLREQDEQRLKLEQGVEPLREKINDLKLKCQAANLNQQQFVERLAEVHVVSDADEAPFVDELKKSLRDSILMGKITRLTAEIESLGAVNLAALDELATATERKGFLDMQSTDLAQAIATLEDAIRRIDRETREQLQETYNTVNKHFGSLFPQLFGGGEAKLLLTGEEILDAGIQIMAQPPGKKNTTIHLLSGGEKALTAIALVFALFQLNPAPFCMLDEVDAPLDDSNTVRFCEMVKRMSLQTQFIFISHNKIAMEMAEQLIGVTMQEQGVSRVVEVDIQEALRLADSQQVA
ncbi:MAG: chromosome segregation protein SMC [Rhodocyclaceae bacterium]|nr:chromosome segregation protein SMC [Rhodocyclaceae bacterium]